jgi:hypothetical protein
MADCKLLAGCIFFNDKMPMDSGLGALFKKSYCQGDFMKCARFRVAEALGRERVPGNLYPNMFEEAEKLIVKG